MSRITMIEKNIKSLDAGKFQRLCDGLLNQLLKPISSCSKGMKEGTDKTTKGVPDCWFQMRNGKYILSEYTTQESNLFEKLKKDIEGCLDCERTRIELSDIDEIICCHTSSNLDVYEDKKLHEICENKGISLRILGINEIARQLDRYPYLAKEHLNMSLDTGQIMTIDNFVSSYNSRETVSPLNTIFQYRADMLEQLENSILDEKVVIIQGAAGSGKTRLAIETLRSISLKTDWTVYCIMSNGLSLRDDLILTTTEAGKYLFLVDDASKLSDLNILLDMVTSKSCNTQIHLVLTVRNYEMREINKTVKEFLIPKVVDLFLFTDEQIKNFIIRNTGISHYVVVDQITKLAKGNPRMAYMAGKVIKDKRSLSALRNAIEIYDAYYTPVVERILDKENGNKLLITAGLIGLMQSFCINRLECLSPLLKFVGISEEDFKNNIQVLSDFKMIEIYESSIVVISDHCLADYLLYLVFYKTNEISLSDLILKSFEYCRNNIVHLIYMLKNFPGGQELENYVIEVISEVWTQFESKDLTLFEEFSRLFNIFKPDAALFLAKKKIDNIKEEKFQDRIINFAGNRDMVDNDILDYLVGFNGSEYLSTVIELVILYAGKGEKQTVNAFKWLKEHYGITIYTSLNDYLDIQIILNEFGKVETDQTPLLFLAIEYVFYVLSFKFNYFECSDAKGCYIYNLALANSNGAADYRAIGWNLLIRILSSCPSAENRIGLFLKSYATDLIKEKESGEIITREKPLVEKVIELINFQKLELNDIEKGMMIKNLQKTWISLNLPCERLKTVFQSDIFDLYELLSKDKGEWDVKGNISGEIIDDDLLVFVEKITDETLNHFLSNAKEVLMLLSDSRDRYIVDVSINNIIIYLVRKKPIDLLKLLECIKDQDIKLEGSWHCLFEELFRCYDPEIIWSRLHEDSRTKATYLDFLFFVYVPRAKIDDNVYSNLLAFFSGVFGPYNCVCCELVFLRKFLIYNKDIYSVVSEFIWKNRDKSHCNTELFSSYFRSVANFSPEELLCLFSSNIVLLQDIYFYVLKKVIYIDVDGEYLQYFISNSNGWLEKLKEHIISSESPFVNIDTRITKVVWNSENPNIFMDEVFEYLIERYVPEHIENMVMYESVEFFCFNNCDQWILHAVEKYAFKDQIKCLFYILQVANDNIRFNGIKKFLSVNNDLNTFNNMPLHPYNNNLVIMKELPNDILKQIAFFEKLKKECKGTKYLGHAQRISQEIELLRKKYKEEKQKAYFY